MKRKTLLGLDWKEKKEELNLQCVGKVDVSFKSFE